MEVKATKHDNFSTLELIGEIDANSSMDLDAKITEQIENGEVNLHINCSGLSYISSAGLGVFISFLDLLNEKGGKFVFSGMSDNIFNSFDLLGLPSLMKILRNGEDIEKEFDE